MELHDGDIITFKDVIDLDNITDNTSFYINFRYGTNLDTMKKLYITSASGSKILYYGSDSNNRYTVGYYSSIEQNGSVIGWNSNKQPITIYGDQTITDEAFINWLYENTVSGLPPRVMENIYSVVGDQIQYSFSNISDVVGSIVNNGVLTIFTLGIFIVSLAVGLLRRISRRKNFK